MSEPLDARTARPMHGGPSFTLGNRVLRAVWGLTWLVLCRFTPPPLHGSGAEQPRILRFVPRRKNGQQR